MRTAGLLLALASGGVLAAEPVADATEDAAPTAAAPEPPPPQPEPHWSGLPIWGVEAEQRGFAIPAPFGVGVTAYAAEQPVTIHDLRLGFRGATPTSVDALQIDRVETSQRNTSLKFDVLVLPFLDVYAIGGYTTGTTEGTIDVAPLPPPLGGALPAQLHLDASFGGPTWGAGFTLQGGRRLREEDELTAIVVLDWNRTRTDLEFDNEALVAETQPEATVLSARIGLHRRVGASSHGALWIGGMHQEIQQLVSGRVAGTDVLFAVVQSPEKPWNTLVGGLLEFGDDGGYVLAEAGLGARRSLLLAATFRF